MAVFRAIEYLEQNFQLFQEPYSAALTAYALTLYKSSFAEEARALLFNMGLHSKNSGETDHWSIEDEWQELDPGSFNIGDSMKQTGNDHYHTVIKIM